MHCAISRHSVHSIQLRCAPPSSSPSPPPGIPGIQKFFHWYLNLHEFQPAAVCLTTATQYQPLAALNVLRTVGSICIA